MLTITTPMIVWSITMTMHACFKTILYILQVGKCTHDRQTIGLLKFVIIRNLCICFLVFIMAQKLRTPYEALLLKGFNNN